MRADALVFGCGNFGGIGSNPKFYQYGDDNETAQRLLDISYDLGIHRFDTANSYGGGASECILGAWLKTKSAATKQKLSIYSKVGNPFGVMDPKRSPLSRGEILASIDQSLRRLQVDHIHTYYMHEMDPAVEADDILAAFLTAKSAGKIGSIGLSNVSLHDVKRFFAAAGTADAPSIAIVQNEYNYLATKDAEELIPFLHAQGLAYAAYSPLAGGLLTRPCDTHTPAAKDRRLARFAEHYQRFLKPEGLGRITALSQIAAQSRQTMAEAALQFIVETPGVSHVIIAPRSETQFRELGLD